MPRKKDIDLFEISETGNWNVAADFSKLKIMKQLYLADEYETIATFGAEDLFEELTADDNLKTISRLRALKRLLKTLQMIINNTKFAVKKQDKEPMKKFLEQLNKINEAMPLIESESYNQKTGRYKTEIIETHFSKVLNSLIQIKSEINEPLNRADLIFTHTEEFDPKAAKEAIKKLLTETG